MLLKTKVRFTRSNTHDFFLDVNDIDRDYDNGLEARWLPIKRDGKWYVIHIFKNDDGCFKDVGYAILYKSREDLLAHRHCNVTHKGIRFTAFEKVDFPNNLK